MLAVRERGTHGSARQIAQPIGSGVADVLMVILADHSFWGQ